MTFPESEKLPMNLDFGIARAAGEIRFVHRRFETMFDQSFEGLAIGAGAILPNIPDGYTRKGPDLGAYKLARNCCAIGRGPENANYPLHQGMEAVLCTALSVLPATRTQFLHHFVQRRSGPHKPDGTSSRLPVRAGFQNSWWV